MPSPSAASSSDPLPITAPRPTTPTHRSLTDASRPHAEQTRWRAQCPAVSCSSLTWRTSAPAARCAFSDGERDQPLADNHNVRTKPRSLDHSVQEYDVPSATLVLKHRYPVSADDRNRTAPAGVAVTARVNIEHVLESLKSEDLQVGAWVNVVGYVQRERRSRSRRRGTAGTATACREGGGMRRGSKVQAVMLWSAGAVKLDAYERAVELRKQSETESRGLGLC